MSIFDKDLIEKETLTESVVKSAFDLWKNTHKSKYDPIMITSPEEFFEKLRSPKSYFERMVLIYYVMTAMEEPLKLNYICNETGEPYERNRWSPGWTYTFNVDKL